MQIRLKYCGGGRRIVLQFQSASAVKLYILRYYRGGMKNVKVILYRLRNGKNMVQLSGQSDGLERGRNCL